LPPFYYKDVSDDGLFASYANVIERIGDAALKIYLYHIPPIAQVGISLDLIGRLLRDYADTVVGLKDSSGDWQHTIAILKEYPALATFCGSEVFLLETLRNGGAGSITATGNTNPAGIRKIFEHWQEPDAASMQKHITSIRRAFEGYALIPALKAVAANYYDAPEWYTVRPPLRALCETEVTALMSRLGQLEFSMTSMPSASGASANDA